ncbi:Dnaj subfamily b member 14, partial [Globisporangium splendens]
MAARGLHEEDFYQVLGVPRSATTDEIKAAYRKLALLHHPDRANSVEQKDGASNGKAQILKINAAYDTLSDSASRVKYDMDVFGTSTSPDYKGPSFGGDNYKPMTAQDVDNMFSGLNTYERFTTAQYHARRSFKAPAAIGRRRTEFNERKAFRASKLPKQSVSVAWLGFPVFIMALWGFNVSSIKEKAASPKKYTR